MEDPIKAKIDGKEITLFQSESAGAPIVYANMYDARAGEEVLKQCRRLGCRPFHFVCITGLRWDEELSLWAHEPVISADDHFTGEAEQYVRCMEEKIVPFVEERIAPHTEERTVSNAAERGVLFAAKQIEMPRRIIAGYSMGGLFALYAPYVTDLFSASVSASGSVWYPSFLSYVKEQPFLKKPDAIYLSLGDRESRTRHPYFSQTESCMRDLYSIYQSRSITTIFELNPGNHHKDAAYRLAKGIAWIHSIHSDNIMIK